MSLVLRHSPEVIGLRMDENGRVETEELLQKAKRKRIYMDFKTMEEVVRDNDKKRFSFNSDKTKIRANQGHSIKVDLEMEIKEPPSYLYHGTVAKFLDSIKEKGLIKGSRQHVHLSSDRETATKVGSRRGRPIILSVNTIQMFQDGYTFYLSENKVWLTDHVPSKYIEF